MYIVVVFDISLIVELLLFCLARGTVTCSTAKYMYYLTNSYVRHSTIPQLIAELQKIQQFSLLVNLKNLKISPFVPIEQYNNRIH